MLKTTFAKKARGTSKIRGRTRIINGNKTTTEKLKVFEEEPAFVNVKLGVTLNLGGYESVRIDLGYTSPCLPKDRNATQKILLTELQQKLKLETKKILADIKKKRLLSEQPLQ